MHRSAVREGGFGGWARSDPHPAASQANAMMPELYKQARQMLTNAARGVHIDGTAKVVQHQEIEPITASEHEHCFEDRPHPTHTIKKMTMIVHGG